MAGTRTTDVPTPDGVATERHRTALHDLLTRRVRPTTS